jgi:hypothetical protein
MTNKQIPIGKKINPNDMKDIKGGWRGWNECTTSGYCEGDGDCSFDAPCFTTTYIYLACYNNRCVAIPAELM